MYTITFFYCFTDCYYLIGKLHKAKFETVYKLTNLQLMDSSSILGFKQKKI